MHIQRLWKSVMNMLNFNPAEVMMPLAGLQPTNQERKLKDRKERKGKGKEIKTRQKELREGDIER